MFKILQACEMQMITGGLRIGGWVGEQLQKATDPTPKATTAECINEKGKRAGRGYHADHYTDAFNFCCKDGKKLDGSNYAGMFYILDGSYTNCTNGEKWVLSDSEKAEL